METRPFRILSPDGGGIMGAFTASALATFERATGRRIVEHFDLITGTSTSGVIAIGLAMGASMEEVTRFYETEGPKIFSTRSGVRAWLGRVQEVFHPKFSSNSLCAAIEGVVGDRPLKEAKTRLVIPTYDVNTGKVYLFKTPHHPRHLNHADITAVDVGLATSAAPTYFAAHTISGWGTFIEGARGPTARRWLAWSRHWISWAKRPSTFACSALARLAPNDDSWPRRKACDDVDG
jgi:patatin-like phospholipase/acyl hydrolase